MTSGLDYVETTGIWLWGRDFRIGEIRFSNAMTTSIFHNSGNSLPPALREGGLSERGLTTKELDPAADVHYFYQRWYDPQTATFSFTPS